MLAFVYNADNIMKKIILHLCADTGSDSYPYSQDPNYEVIRIGSEIGVENYHPPKNVYGVFANPVCTEFSTARKGGQPRNPEEGMFLVKHCQRIISECENLKFWVIENPARGVLKNYLGKPTFSYQPYQFGSPWSKHTALWGNFNIPKVIYPKWENVPEEIKIKELYVRPTATYANGQTRKATGVPSLAFMHGRKHLKYIEEFKPFFEIAERKGNARSNGADMEFRSLCSQKFAQEFYKLNK